MDKMNDELIDDLLPMPARRVPSASSLIDPALLPPRNPSFASMRRMSFEEGMDEARRRSRGSNPRYDVFVRSDGTKKVLERVVGIEVLPRVQRPHALLIWFMRRWRKNTRNLLARPKDYPDFGTAFLFAVLIMFALIALLLAAR